MKNTNSGFTLIELIIVIVILGILAVTASPKFLDLTGDARTSTIEGLAGSVNGAASISNSRAIIQGQTGTSGFLDANNNSTNDSGETQLVNGYPDAESLDLTLDLDTTNDWTVVEGDTKVRIYPKDVTAHAVSSDTFSNPSGQTADVCYLEYTEAVSGNRPAITPISTTTTGC